MSWSGLDYIPDLRRTPEEARGESRREQVKQNFYMICSSIPLDLQTDSSLFMN